MAPMDDRWKAVGAAVKARRGELEMSQEELAEVSGVSVPTIRILENARQAGYQAATLAKICRALHWTADSIQRILDGEGWLPSVDIITGPIPEPGGPGVETDALSRWHDAMDFELRFVIDSLTMSQKLKLLQLAMDMLQEASEARKASSQFALAADTGTDDPGDEGTVSKPSGAPEDNDA